MHYSNALVSLHLIEKKKKTRFGDEKRKQTNTIAQTQTQSYIWI